MFGVIYPDHGEVLVYYSSQALMDVSKFMACSPELTARFAPECYELPAVWRL